MQTSCIQWHTRNRLSTPLLRLRLDSTHGGRVHDRDVAVAVHAQVALDATLVVGAAAKLAAGDVGPEYRYGRVLGFQRGFQVRAVAAFSRFICRNRQGGCRGEQYGFEREP